MRRVIIFIFTLFTQLQVQAAPITIQDNFIGGGATHASYATADIVGTVDTFDISSLTMNITESVISVSIRGSYFDNVGLYSTHFGDVFLSIDGWKPYGASPYVTDDSTNGETWEYALVFSNHGEQFHNKTTGTSMIGASGQVNLVRVDSQSDIALSEADGIYRANQEVSVRGASLQNVLSSGTWEITQDTDGYSMLSLSTSILGTPLRNAADIGFHFAYSCGNDVIQGVVTNSAVAHVPEPGVLILLLSGLAGFRGLSRHNS